jgi:hypothetical protein
MIKNLVVESVKKMFWIWSSLLAQKTKTAVERAALISNFADQRYALRVT